MAEEKTVITLICERAAEVDSVMSQDDKLKDMPNVKVVKFPCSGMIQPLMVEAAMKAGASGVVVCGCQIGDCYYREGNRMIKDRLMGSRPPGLKPRTDRRRVLALWLSRKQTDRFLSETKEFVTYVSELDKEEGTTAAVPKKVEAKKPAEKVETKADDKKADKVEAKKAEEKKAEKSEKSEEKAEKKEKEDK
jgi:F420-non-reducing hydrogenase iron-sulfur subunit